MSEPASAEVVTNATSERQRGGGMSGLVRAEWTKLFTTKVWIGLLLGSCVLVGAFAAFTTGFAGNEESPIPPVGTPQFEQVALANATSVNVIFLILGIIGMTQEYRHRTATPTFLTTPRRGRAVVAKLVAYAIAAVPFALVVLAVNYVVVLIYAGARGAAPSLDADNLRVLLCSGLALVIYAVVGVGLGALLRNQVAAVVGLVIYLFVVEPILSAIPKVQSAYPYLPGGAASALVQTSDPNAQGSGYELLDPWVGGAVLLAYGLLFAILGSLLTVRRDVT